MHSRLGACKQKPLCHIGITTAAKFLQFKARQNCSPRCPWRYLPKIPPIIGPCCHPGLEDYNPGYSHSQGPTCNHHEHDHVTSVSAFEAWRDVKDSQGQEHWPQVCGQQFIQASLTGLWFRKMWVGDHQCGAYHLPAGGRRHRCTFGSQRIFQCWWLFQSPAEWDPSGNESPAEEVAVMSTEVYTNSTHIYTHTKYTRSYMSIDIRTI